MEISPYMLSLLLVYSLIFGMSAGVFNDANRIARIAFAMRKTSGGQKKNCARKIYETAGIFLISIQDILLFAYIGVGVVILNYYLNRGIFRIYSIAAAAIGFVIYYFTIGRVVMFFAERIIRALRFAIVWILNVVTAPVRLIFRLLLHAAKKLFEKLCFAIAKRKNMRYNKIKREELMARARCGFAADGATIRKGVK